MKTINKQQPFIITASNISAIANHHQYKDWQIALADTLGRYNQVSGYTSVEKMIDQTNELPLVELPPKALDYAKVYKASAALREKGKQAEKSIIEDLRTSDLGDIDTTDVLIKKTIVIEDWPVLVMGRTDGRTRSGAVVEIKNRKNRFFEPDYDLDQLATYVVLTNANEGILVQNHEDALKINRYTQKEMIARWERLLCDLKPAVQLFKTICTDRHCSESQSILKMMVPCD